MRIIMNLYIEKSNTRTHLNTKTDETHLRIIFKICVLSMPKCPLTTGTITQWIIILNEDMFCHCPEWKGHMCSCSILFKYESKV